MLFLIRHAEPYDSLKDVALKILQNKVATVPIIRSPSHGESFPHLLYLASLSEIMKCICRHFRHSSVSLPFLQQAICTIPLGTWIQRTGESNGRHLAMLRPNESLSSCLALLVQAQVSSIPIIDDHDCLLDAYSRSDITSLAKDNAYARIHLDDMRIYQILFLFALSSKFCFHSILFIDTSMGYDIIKFCYAPNNPTL
ncbi:hypothetical protein BHE74_00057743 [Ensete ventricosum]|nr:hypothetical protein GW17_00055817 [Ensete ventricosum]RWW37183.1 hypothetical protein BHE74_00057743 [Ensete ventricosum]RZR93364.1 hypothetical protein BHM03_00021854 [Ensete ventricosum]